MGPNPAQPMDIQTAQAQLQLQQQIAQALLASGMSPTQMLDTGAVKTANWGDALGKMAEIFAGRQSLDKIGAAQQDLAQQSNEMYQRDVQKVYDTLKQTGDVGQAVGEASKSLHPEVQKIAGALMQAYLKQMVTPEVMGSMVGRGGIDPTSIPPAMGGTNMLIRPELLRKLPIMESGEGGAKGEFTPTAPPGQRLQPAGTLQPPVSPVTPAGAAPGGGIQLPTQVTPKGTTEVVPGSAEAPNVLIQKKNAEQQVGALETGKVAAQSFMEHEPVFEQMIKLIDTAGMGAGREWIRQAQKWAVRLGVSQDDAHQIDSIETLMKYALPQAAHAARDFNARSTQIEFINFKEAMGADPNMDPRTARNIFMHGIMEGMNQLEVHNQNIKKASGTPAIGPDVANTYTVPISPDSVMSSMSTSKIPFSVTRDEKTGMWRNREPVENVEAGKAAAAAPRQSVKAPPPPGTVVKGYKFKGGNPADKANWEKVSE